MTMPNNRIGMHAMSPPERRNGPGGTRAAIFTPPSAVAESTAAPRCLRCRRPLRAAVSVLRCRGPVCHRHERQAVTAA